ncbi:hypothetical protein AM2010_2102 [Pelagerythrobacter marensis]|uniref:Uncharacterized protein n=1 Tax=Pelagerythrobacter marensis TaxID=543877 RepID=A0A0G3XAE0_9SPHN|nr:hypothetical protein AM2010_2102 [Pelagerythrobacter marensis]
MLAKRRLGLIGLRVAVVPAGWTIGIALWQGFSCREESRRSYTGERRWSDATEWLTLTNR